MSKQIKLNLIFYKTSYTNLFMATTQVHTKLDTAVAILATNAGLINNFLDFIIDRSEVGIPTPDNKLTEIEDKKEDSSSTMDAPSDHRSDRQSLDCPEITPEIYMIDDVQYNHKSTCSDSCCTYYTDDGVSTKIHGQMHMKYDNGLEQILTYVHGKVTIAKYIYGEEECCETFDGNNKIDRVIRRDDIIIQNIIYDDNIPQSVYVYNNDGDLLGTYIRGGMADKIRWLNFDPTYKNIEQIMKLFSHAHWDNKNNVLEADIFGDKLTRDNYFNAYTFIRQLNPPKYDFC